MNNGCICCTVRGDLIRIIGRADEAKGTSSTTSSLKRPASPIRTPVAQTFFVDEDVRRKTQARRDRDVVDAKHLGDQLDDAPRRKEQIAFADIVVLNKTDLVGGQELMAVKSRIRAMNPTALIHETERCGIELDQILERGAFSLDRILEVEPDFLDGDHAHEHDDEVTSLSLTSDHPMDPTLFFPWIQDMTQRFGVDIMRMKGIIAFKNDADRFVVQSVHMLLEGDHQRPWKDGEPRTSRLVFIGRNLPKDALREGFNRAISAEAKVH